ncbi:MAG TPA: ribosome biogenesis GTPase Der [Anaerolineales bacterium]|nr:ribosome biogenesis GTPase Der [Anaerolineales bacterium]
MRKSLVALVGRPNVGKSTLFNRIVGERLAVVDETPGTTRDRIIAEGEWNGTTFDLVDTGGLEDEKLAQERAPVAIDSARFVPEIRAQTEIAIETADVIVFLCSLQDGLTEADREVAELLRRKQRTEGGVRKPPIVLAVNKGDSLSIIDSSFYDFYELGIGEPIAVSALHGTGTGDLLDAVVNALPKTVEPTDEEEERVKIAIVGRPNVGKSSLLNRLLGEERAIVSPIAGTTRDAVDTYLTYEGTSITLIDTAGIRRRGHIDPGVEKYSVLRSHEALARCDVALLLIDATEPFTAQDAHVAGFILEQWKSVVVVVNKWDAIEKDNTTMESYKEKLAQAFQFVKYAPVLFISAKTGQRTGQVLATALDVYNERFKRVATSTLNKVLREAMELHPPPAAGSRRLKIRYASQVRVAPPVFLFHVNDRELVHFSYSRFLENRLRETFGFLGTPIRLSFRSKEDENDD